MVVWLKSGTENKMIHKTQAEIGEMFAHACLSSSGSLISLEFCIKAILDTK